MTHVITRACCNDASCVAVCPVNCIHPTPEEPEFATAEMLYIDPATCIDCGQCLDECPVSAIVRDDEMTARDQPYLAINANYYRDHNVRSGAYMRRRGGSATLAGGLRVAIVGTGPSGFFVAERLLDHQNVSVDMYDRLPTPYGLVRAGVAPDHQDTKNVQRIFERVSDRAGFRYLLNVDVGQDITHQELAQHYHAVVYATGAPADHKLGVPGEDLPNSFSATEVVAWYNGQAGRDALPIDLSVEDAVIIGNGNVALDVARILSLGPDSLRRSDIPSHALDALRRSAIKRVTVLARRDAAQAAYSNPEFLALTQHPDFTVAVQQKDLALHPDTRHAWNTGALDSTTAAKIQFAVEAAERTKRVPEPSGRTVQMRYLVTPLAIQGSDAGCAGVRTQPYGYSAEGTLHPDGEEEIIPAGLVIRAIGYRGRPIPSLPFNDSLGIVPNHSGHVTGMEGTYVAGWIKRGPKGGIGRNRLCSLETADSILADYAEASLPEPTKSPGDVLRLLAERGVTVVDQSGWHKIDSAEVTSGRLRGAPREKFVDIAAMLAVVNDRTSTRNMPA